MLAKTRAKKKIKDITFEVRNWAKSLRKGSIVLFAEYENKPRRGKIDELDPQDTNGMQYRVVYGRKNTEWSWLDNKEIVKIVKR